MNSIHVYLFSFFLVFSNLHAGAFKERVLEIPVNEGLYLLDVLAITQPGERPSFDGLLLRLEYRGIERGKELRLSTKMKPKKHAKIDQFSRDGSYSFFGGVMKYKKQNNNSWALLLKLAHFTHKVTLTDEEYMSHIQKIESALKKMDDSRELWDQFSKAWEGNRVHQPKK